MTTIQTNFDEGFEVVIQTSLLSAFTFMTGWVDKSSQELTDRALFIEFNNGCPLLHVRKVPKDATDIAMLYTLDAEGKLSVTSPPPELDELILGLPLHKLLSVANWAGREDSSSITISVNRKGDAFALGGNNSIQLDTAWVDGKNLTSLFAEYKGSALANIDQLYDVEKVDGSKYLTYKSQVMNADGQEPLRSVVRRDFLSRDAAVSKVDSNLVYVKNTQLPTYFSDHDKMCDVTYDVELGKLVKKVTDKSLHPKGHTAVSYSRMSMFFTSMAGTFSDTTPLAGSDGSIPSSFIGDLQVLFKAIADASGNDELWIDYVVAPSDLNSEAGIAFIRLAVVDGEGRKTGSAIFNVPAAGMYGMAPPSKEDLNVIVPDIDEESSMYAIVDYRSLMQTLQFWDSLQRVDGNDIVTPLKPISLEVVDNKMMMRMQSEKANNEASFELVASSNFTTKEIQVPFEPLMRIVSSSLFQESSEENLTIVRPLTDDPAQIVITRGGNLAVIAEFI